MPKAHRHGDGRTCGATTVVQNQSTVFVNGKLWAVEGDPNSHGDGGLNASIENVFIESKKVIIHKPDHADPDTLCFIVGPPHCDPETAGGSGDVFAGGAD